MGRASRPRPKRLGSKLKIIRQHLGLSQVAMCKRLNVPTIHPSYISGYERGKREPPYHILLEYARISGVSTDVLLDDHAMFPQ
ncbi:MAG TPA: helix-turn-helix transcriptional regulator [Pyrinomonadaceae bacterium]|nr:helix-turn-helix transcriptional regulator [Pyrinomonadaceae bacterium]